MKWRQVWVYLYAYGQLINYGLTIDQLCLWGVLPTKRKKREAEKFFNNEDFRDSWESPNISRIMTPRRRWEWPQRVQYISRKICISEINFGHLAECGKVQLKLIVKELVGMKGSDFIWLKVRASGEQFDWLTDLHWFRGLTVPLHLGLIEGFFVPHNLTSAQGSPVPLPKLQMTSKLKILMSSGSKNGTQICYPFLSKVPASDSPPQVPQWGPVPLPKLQMTSKVKILMSSGSKNGTQTCYPFLSKVPASDSPLPYVPQWGPYGERCPYPEPSWRAFTVGLHSM